MSRKTVIEMKREKGSRAAETMETVTDDKALHVSTTTRNVKQAFSQSILM